MKKILILILLIGIIGITGCSDNYVIKKGTTGTGTNNYYNTYNNITQNITNNITSNTTNNITNNLTNNYATYNGWDNSTGIVLTNQSTIVNNSFMMDDGTFSCDKTLNMCQIGGGMPLYYTGIFEIENGIYPSNNGNGSTLDIGGYINDPFINIGEFQNYLLQTETFGTTWVKMNGSAVVADTEISPIGTQIAERLDNNNTDTGVYQNITLTYNGTWIFSVYMRSNNATAIAGLQIRTNTVNYTLYNFTLKPNWERYEINTTITDIHTIIQVRIINGIYNVSVWGAQLEPNATNPRPYSGAQTTTATTTITRQVTTPLPILTKSTLTTTGITSSGSCGCTAVAVGGALSGATTGTFSSTSTFGGTMTQSVASTLNTLSLYGLVLTTATASTSAIPSQGATMLSFRGKLWDGTADTTQEWNIGTTGNNLTKETSLILFNQNTLGENTSILNITHNINSTVMDVSVMWSNSTLEKYYANDNRSQLMCLNISQTGTVTAYKC